jgi:hypothetical protein
MSICDEGKTWTDFMIYREQPTVGSMDAGELLINSYDSGDIAGDRRKDDETQEGFTGTCDPATPTVAGTLDFYITINDRPYHFEATTRKQTGTFDTYVATGTYTALDLEAKPGNSQLSMETMDPGDSGNWEGKQGSS